MSECKKCYGRGVLGVTVRPIPGLIIPCPKCSAVKSEVDKALAERHEKEESHE